MMKIVVHKAKRSLHVFDAGGTECFSCPVALGKAPLGHKMCAGDGKTPEGAYSICLKRETGKFGCALGISYPNLADAEQGVRDGRLAPSLLPLFAAAESTQKRPPWGTSLGGEIYLHGGGTSSDWTAGCIALSDSDMKTLFALCQEGDRVVILP